MAAASSLRSAMGVCVVVALAAPASCKCSGASGGGGEPVGEADAGEPSGADDAADGLDAPGGGAPLAGRPSRDAAPEVDVGKLLGAVADEACTGKTVDLGEAITDPRCAIRSAQAKALLAALPDAGLPLRQLAARQDGGVIEVRLVNTGAAPIALPLSWHTKIGAFSAIAEDESHALYELAAPAFTPARADGRVHFARVVLPPGGVGFARIAPKTAIVERLSPPCEAGTCAPPVLAPGTYTLHVGELITDVEAGEPARVVWVVAP